MKKTKLYTLLTMVMILWGLNVVAIKLLVEGCPPLTISGIRVTLGGLIILLYLRLSTGFQMMSKKDFWSILAIGILCFASQHILLAYGILQTSATHTTLILALNPLATALLAAIVLKTSFSVWRMLGVALGFIGVLAIFIGEEGSWKLVISMGDGLIFFTMLIQALGFVVIKPLMEQVNVAQVTGLSLAVGGITISLTAFVVERVSPFSVLQNMSMDLLVILFTSAFLATGLGGLVWNAGIKEIGSGQTAIFINMTPFFGLLGAAVFLNEEIKLAYLLGFALIAMGVYLGSGAWEERRAQMQQLNKAT